MEQNQNIEKDFKKWISFNDKLSDYQNLYEFYAAIDSRKSVGGVAFHEPVKGQYLLEQKDVDVTLELESEEERKQILKYLLKHYFPNEDVDSWYRSKQQTEDKAINHNVLVEKNQYQPKTKTDQFRVHPKEVRYYNFRFFFSLLFYLGIIGYVLVAFLQSTPAGLAILGIMLGSVIVLSLSHRVVQGLFIGMIKGNSVKINAAQ